MPLNILLLITTAPPFPVPKTIDTKLSTSLAEGWIGAAKDVDNFVSIVLGTGIGGAVVIN